MSIELLPKGDMSDAELRRYRAGRHDWSDDRWEDHCGDPDCKTCDGEMPIPGQ